MDTQSNMNEPDNFSELNPDEKAILTAILAQGHPTAEELAEMALGTIDDARRTKIDDHLAICAVCMKTFNELQGETELLDVYLESRLSDKPITSGKKKGKTAIFYLPAFRYAAAAVLVFGLFYSGLNLFPEVFLPKRYTLGNLKSLQTLSITRGLDNPQLQEAQFQIQNKKYESAIALLESYTKADRQNAFYSNYLLGLTYLHASQGHVALIIPNYRADYLAKAKDHLLKCIALNDNPQLQNISLDAAFYAAKASILLGQMDEAKQLLRKVIDEKGAMMDESKQLIEHI